MVRSADFQDQGQGCRLSGLKVRHARVALKSNAQHETLLVECILSCRANPFIARPDRLLPSLLFDGAVLNVPCQLEVTNMRLGCGILEGDIRRAIRSSDPNPTKNKRQSLYKAPRPKRPARQSTPTSNRHSELLSIKARDPGPKQTVE